MNSPRAVLTLAASALALAACASGPPSNGNAVAVRQLGESYKSAQGDVLMIRVQDEYQLIQCVPEGPIAGCFKDVFKMPRDQITDDATAKDAVRWNEWIDVPHMPGLQVSFLGPDRIALRELHVAAPVK